MQALFEEIINILLKHDMARDANDRDTTAANYILHDDKSKSIKLWRLQPTS